MKVEIKNTENHQDIQRLPYYKVGLLSGGIIILLQHTDICIQIGEDLRCHDLSAVDNPLATFDHTQRSICHNLLLTPEFLIILGITDIIRHQAEVQCLRHLPIQRICGAERRMRTVGGVNVVVGFDRTQHL